MIIQNYDEVVKELIDNKVISGADVYDYSLYQNPHIFNQFFKFCQENLSKVCVENDYKIEPSKIYFTNRPSVNAAAGHGSVYYVIKVNMGVLHNLFDLFCNNTILDDPELADYKEFGEFLEGVLDEKQRVSLSFLMFQTGILFTYYHELAHLIQFSNKDGMKGMRSEQYIKTDNDAFEPLKHIDEYDADQHGGNNVAFHIVSNIWNKLPEEHKTDDIMKKLITVSLVGIMGYIFFLWNTLDEELYFNKYDHPHPLIRIIWIAAVLINTIKAKFTNVQEKEIMDETLRVLDVYFKHKGKGDIKSKFREPLVREYPDVMGYCQAVLEWSERIPYLVVNTIHKKPRQNRPE